MKRHRTWAAVDTALFCGAIGLLGLSFGLQWFGAALIVGLGALSVYPAFLASRQVREARAAQTEAAREMLEGLKK